MAELFQYPSKDLEYWNGCQRNWDYSRPVEPDHVRRLIDIALSAPSKNNLNLLEIQVFENSLETQKNITEKAKGSENEAIKTSTEAPLTFFFGYRKNQATWLKEESQHDFLEMMSRANGVNEKFYWECMRHADMAASIIVGAVSIKAVEFGYKTGINCCFMQNPPTLLYNSEYPVFLSVGIGHPLHEDHSLRRYPNHLTEEQLETAIKHNGAHLPPGTLQGPYRTKYKTKFTHIKNNVVITSE